MTEHRHRMRALWLLLFFAAAAIVRAQPLAGPEVWLTHAEQDLARFWLNDAYEGDPAGSRDDLGELMDGLRRLEVEFSAAPEPGVRGQ